jgi:putative transposase
MTTFSFTARASTDQQKAIARHVGARRFAWNQSLRLVLDAQKQKKTDPSVEVPRSAYSLINAINGWKRSEGAGRCFVVGSNGQTTAHLGLPWRHQVCAQVLEEAAVDLARALGAADKAKGTNRRVGFPNYQKKGRCAESLLGDRA